jgi:hypothetical protein
VSELEWGPVLVAASVPWLVTRLVVRWAPRLVLPSATELGPWLALLLVTWLVRALVSW